ncbi:MULTISPECIES: 50S ribosomal protein L28 [Candidatus Regiella]|uniref:Large ribosomal subunit protein bL28 n=1 Tax=Candidatus Regiella insecticola 5.15 TaxID=1005043 RepID=G2H2F6_9ENTR|nr:50S ribosomal protein L28 [Candidatus Regiella insecticola]EGY27819.1 ribosomal protein L28 [Candidatus Regiella insecticola 5.15]
MSRICPVSGKRAMRGNKRSHAMNATKRSFNVNLQSHRFWDTEKGRFVKLRISTKAMRTIDKHGIEKVLKTLDAKGVKY